MRIRRILLFAVLFSGLAGCSPLGGGSLDTLKMALVGSRLVFDESRLTPGIAYARAEIGQSKLLIGRNPTSDDGREIWYTAAHQVLIFQRGLLVGTAGMPADLIDVRYPEPHPLAAGLAGLSLPLEFVREVDRPDLSRETSRLRLEDCGRETLQTWGVSGPVRCLRERLLKSNVANPLPGNTYWIAEDTGQWRQSVQWISPDWRVLLQPRPGPVQALLRHDEASPDRDATRSRLRMATPAHLSDLLFDYPLSTSRRPVAAWFARDAEGPQYRRKRGVLFDLRQALSTKDMDPAVKARMQRLQDEVAAMPVTGRKTLPVLEPRWLAVNVRHDVVLAAGDRLLRRPLPPTSALVLGNVAEPCRRNVDAGVTVASLLADCLGNESLPDTVYLIDSAGAVSPVGVALWNRQVQPVPPGSLVYVPFPAYATRSGNSDADADMARWLATQFDLADTPAQRQP